MAMPFDTLKLARPLESAGFPPRQAGDMAEAIAEADIRTRYQGGSTKRDARYGAAPDDPRWRHDGGCGRRHPCRL
jgi:hypothetical protein